MNSTHPNPWAQCSITSTNVSSSKYSYCYHSYSSSSCQNCFHTIALVITYHPFLSTVAGTTTLKARKRPRPPPPGLWPWRRRGPRPGAEAPPEDRVWKGVLSGSRWGCSGNHTFAHMCAYVYMDMHIIYVEHVYTSICILQLVHVCAGRGCVQLRDLATCEALNL